MIGNQKDPIRTKKVQNSPHDQLIVENALAAFRQGATEAACPYQYDLRARKIWLSAFKKEKRRVNKARGKDRTASLAAE